MAGMAQNLPTDLARAIDEAGYFPALVRDVVATALAGDEVRQHLVHVETTFEQDELLRHITVLVLTPTKLVIVHADDHDDSAAGGVRSTRQAVTATSETVALSFVRGVTLTHVVTSPERYRSGSLGREVTLTIGWGTISRIDLLPATCGDPNCDADHGYDGTITGDDISLRISADAEGEGHLQQAMTFAHALSAVVGSTAR
ncbi:MULTISPECIES: DUF5998 family protein [Dermacoccus]|uniref:DUF5998 family protein n=1 Tax=Dermacoccus TaxID=57495 RepID=UPI00093D3D90|nr:MULTISPECIES: DUF5998 family protein [Dermacoccus]MBO1758804.1 phosphodiesterase [Dermacoccus sp. NHGro5]